MGLSDKKQKTTGTSNTTASYNYLNKPSTPALDTLRSQTFEVDPGLSAQYGTARHDLQHSFQNPTGAYLSPQVRDAQLQSGTERLNRDEAQAMRQGQYDVNKLNFARNQVVAQHEAPDLVQTGTTGNQQGTVKQSESPWGSILSAGSQALPLSL